MFPVGREDYLDRIRLHRFRELIVDSDDDVSVGWVPIRNMLGEFTTPTIIFEQQYVVMALRIDKWSIPSALFKAMLNEEIEDTKREEKREHSHSRHARSSTSSGTRTATMCGSPRRRRATTSSSSTSSNERSPGSR
jgi:hypothetical protein